MKRIDDYTFECMLGTLSFLGFKITPTVTAKVDVRPNGAGPMISVEEATISGSKIVEDANEQFQLSSVNDVSWFDSATEECPNQKTIQSETMVSVYLIVPGWFPFTVKNGKDREVCRESSGWTGRAEVFEAVESGLRGVEFRRRFEEGSV